MTAVYVIIFGTVVLLGVSVVAVFLWAIRTRQFESFEKGATSIFDPDDVPGTMTDLFPDEKGDRHVD